MKTLLETEENQQKECLFDEAIHYNEEIDCFIKRLKQTTHLDQTVSVMNKILNQHNYYFYLFTQKYSISSMDTGKFPKFWSVGAIKPIFKNNGESKKPTTSNYRPICILSCLGMLFTMNLNERLKPYIESQSVLAKKRLFQQYY